MRAGHLRHRITVQQAATAPNAYGEPIATWSTYLTAWASIEPASGREYQAAATQQQAVTHKVRMRYRDGVTPEMRIKFTDRTSTDRYFDIESVIEPQVRGVELVLMCREQLA